MWYVIIKVTKELGAWGNTSHYKYFTYITFRDTTIMLSDHIVEARSLIEINIHQQVLFNKYFF